MQDTLIILGSSLTALGIIRNAYKNRLASLLVDIRPGIATKSRIPEITLLNGTSPTEALSVIKKASAKRRKYLMATNDYWLTFIRQNREILNATVDKILNPQNHVIDLCLNKKAFYSWCNENHFKTPEYHEVASSNAPFPSRNNDYYPMFIRPIIHSNYKLRDELPKAIEVKDPNNLAYWTHLFNSKSVDYIVTESLLSHNLTQYSIPIVRLHDKSTSFVARKVRPLPRACAVGCYVELWPNERIEVLAHKIVHTLDYYSVCEVEILHSHDTGEDFLVEVNARPWSQYMLALKSGHDFLKFLIDNKSYEREKEIKTGKTWIDIELDLLYCFSHTAGIVRKKQISPREYLLSLAKANVYSTFFISDPSPFLYQLKRIGHTLKASF